MRELENPSDSVMTVREQEVMDLYTELHEANSHKMVPVPVFKVNSSDRGN